MDLPRTGMGGGSNCGYKKIYYDIVLEGCISQYIGVLYWRDASPNTLDYCIRETHTSIHKTTVLKGCISQYIRLLY